jgi:tetratricopeptide (TPR) repeat protein
MNNAKAQNADEHTSPLIRLRRLFDVSEGCFSFAVATYQTLEIRNQCIKDIQSEYESIPVIAIHDRTQSILEQALDGVQKKKNRAIFITDIETLVVDDNTCVHLVHGLNTSRERWKEHFCCPVVFWIPEYLTTIISRIARDFWSWVSHQFEFDQEMITAIRSQPAIETEIPLMTTGTSTASIESLSLDERKKRQLELEQWLQNPPTDIKMQGVLIRRIDELATIYYIMAEYKKAEPLIKRALAIDEASFGANHPKIARDLNNLAQLLQATNRLKEAEPLMRRALAIDEVSLGNDHRNVARDLNNLAQLLKATNRLEEAEPLMRRALTIDEASFGVDHPSVATDLNNLAALLKATNRIEEAEPLMHRALTIDEASFGADHPNVATRLNNLAQLLKATNRIEEAEPLMRRALAIDEASFGNDHPEVARDLNNLAQLFKATNRIEEAEPLIRRALAIDEASFGADHPNVAIRLNNLALLLADMNHPKEAEPLMRRALAIDEASFGADHPRVAIDLNNLAQLLADTNRIEEAKPLMERHLVIFLQFTRRTGHPHPHLKAAINNYGNLLMQMGESKEQIAARLKGLDPEMFD